MLVINNLSTFNCKRLERLMRSFNSGRYQFDTNAIKCDIERLKKEIINETNNDIIFNKNAIINYLSRRIIGNLNKFNRMRVRWCTEANGSIFTAPIKLLSMRWCGLDMVDYMYKTDENTVVMSYKDIWDAMAFCIAHDDLGYTREDIERQLDNCKLMAINNSVVIKAMVNESTYNDVNMMRIGNSEFYYEDSGARDYFGRIVEEPTYKNILNSSIKYMMACILNELLNSINTDEYIVEFIGIFEDSIYFNTNMDKSMILSNLYQTVVLKLFGRDFEFYPKLRIY